MEYSLSEIADITGASRRPEHDRVITSMLTDSRSLLNPDGVLFFALRTASGDGHKFIPSLYDKGVRNFVVEHLPADAAGMPDAEFLTVDSPLDALQALAAAIRDRSKCTVIGITGSRGKTTVKEWLYRLLSPVTEVVRSPRSFNSQIGVPLSLMQLEPDSKGVAIIEAGISRPGEMARLEKMIRPDIVVFTNIGAPHSRDFESIEEKCREKALLMSGCRQAVFCADNELISASIPSGVKRVGWTRRGNPDAMLGITTRSEGKSTRVSYDWNNGAVVGGFDLPFTAGHDLENAFHCLAVMLLMNAGPSEIAAGMLSLRPISTRLEVTDAVGGCQMIHDRFPSDLETLAIALDFMERRATPDHPLTVILGDLDTKGADPARVYAGAADLLRRHKVGKIIGIGKGVDANALLLGHDAVTFPTVADFIGNVRPESFDSELILVKGSPEEPLAEVARLLEKRRNETMLEINLDAVVDNFNYFRSLIRPGTGMVCMIKASGYGAGSYELAKTLQSQGASYLAVAVHDEGVELRQAGITMPVIVLNPQVDNISTIFDYKLEPEIYSIDFLRSLIAEAQAKGVKGYPVHIKIDSGMHRLGFLLETLPEVIELLKSQDAVVPASIFSHLCCADDPAEDDYTRQQFEYFDRCCDMLLGAFPGRRILRHILNSTGITRFPEHQLDMVRLGIGLYGIRTMHDGSQDALRPVSTLRTCIISLRHWPEGTTIGYNRRGRLGRDSVIATVPIGYADGLNRHLGYGNARFNVGGVLCPTVGSICMDACMIDVTDVPGVAVGDGVEVFGDTIPVETLSDTLQTIPYEVLTSISSRVRRVYYRE